MGVLPADMAVAADMVAAQHPVVDMAAVQQPVVGMAAVLQPVVDMVAERHPADTAAEPLQAADINKSEAR